MIPTPNPYQREGSVDGWGKYGLRSSLLAFKTKWRKKGQKQVSPRQRLGNSSQPTFAQKGQKNKQRANYSGAIPFKGRNRPKQNKKEYKQTGICSHQLILAILMSLLCSGSPAATRAVHFLLDIH